VRDQVKVDVCDHLPENGAHVVHMTFEARRAGGTVGDIAAGADTTPIRSVEFVKLSDLPALGFRDHFAELADPSPPSDCYSAASAGRDMVEVGEASRRARRGRATSDHAGKGYFQALELIWNVSGQLYGAATSEG
jgi:hypothetical protein